MKNYPVNLNLMFILLKNQTLNRQVSKLLPLLRLRTPPSRRRSPFLSLYSSKPSPPRTAAARTRRLRPPLTARPPCTQPRSGTAAGSSSTYQQPRVALRAAQSSRRAVRHAGESLTNPMDSNSINSEDLTEIENSNREDPEQPQIEGEELNRIAPWEKQITVRGIIASLLIKTIYSVIAMKLGLTTGLVPNLN
ncbi:probable metal-nicotianamine transporter YSL14 isoform X1 [Arachis stenosperma]|uniref:probable metal-nicotianamine transporter YSL14 isoform X1 n=1 Tax=Arachis stenosperma TaxID=217475 RepID=UPI0025ABD173|nr:probable metal-nicotianamine transporter YSL14 isoform X1 [Arachis stenosperma]XP_057751226.1 probable metal-nicotianamine transporter YSL14 isoform X1 [Arachis stenosperma]